MLSCFLVLTAKRFSKILVELERRSKEICYWNSIIIYYISMQFLYITVVMNCLAMSE